jgi:VanZ family protein
MSKAWLLKILRLASAWLFWPGFALVVWGSLTPSPPELPGPWAWDKMDHLTAYFGLAAMATMVIGLCARLVWALLALVAMGGILEILQGYTGRDPDIHDFIANSIGVLTSFAVALLFWRVLSPRPLVGAPRGD